MEEQIIKELKEESLKKAAELGMRYYESECNKKYMQDLVVEIHEINVKALELTNETMTKGETNG